MNSAHGAHALMAHLGPEAGVACCGSAPCDTASGTVEKGAACVFSATCSESGAACASLMSAELGCGSAMACGEAISGRVG